MLRKVKGNNGGELRIDRHARDGGERVIQRREGMGDLGPLGVGALAAKYSFGAAIALLASIYVLDIIVTES
jgi:hypothetical protein